MSYSELISQLPPWIGQFDSKNNYDTYFFIRAHIPLGEYKTAKIWLQKAQKVNALDPELISLLFFQINAGSEKPKNDLLTSALTLRNFFDNNDKVKPVIQAEYYFTLGFIANRLCKFHLGKDFNKISSKLYALSFMSQHQANALANQHIALKHLGYFNQADFVFNEIATLSKNNPKLKTIQIRTQTLQAYRSLELEDFSKAIKYFHNCFLIAKKLDRQYDLLSSMSFLIYTHLRIFEFEKADSLLTQAQSLISKSSLSTFNNRIKLFQRAINSPLLNENLYNAIICKTKKNCDGITLFLVLDLLLDRILRSNNDELLFNVSKKAINILPKYEQCLISIDFRYYLILSAIRLEKADFAITILNQYKADAQTDGNFHRIKKANELESMLFKKQNTTQQQKVVINNAITHYNSEVIFLNKHQISRSKKPILFNFFYLLLQKHPIPISIHEIFASIYEEPYHSLKNESRFHSLYTRASKIYNTENSALYRSNGKIGITTPLHYFNSKNKLATLNVNST